MKSEASTGRSHLPLFYFPFVALVCYLRVVVVVGMAPTMELKEIGFDKDDKQTRLTPVAMSRNDRPMDKNATNATGRFVASDGRCVEIDENREESSIAFDYSIVEFDQ